MIDPFADYGKRATTTAVPRLVGVAKTRSEARDRYTALVTELQKATTREAVEAALEAHSSTILQIHSELEFLWSGDADFRGLEKEIEWATARVDDGLDFPRWDPSQPQEQARN